MQITQSWFFPLDLRKRGTPEGTSQKPEEKQQFTVEDSVPLCCSVCSAPVTDQDRMIPVNGATTHSKVNPAGHRFEIACFSSAPGCYEQGSLTNEYSWFSGYQWNFAHCSCCHAQLGWRFSGPDEFFALVTSAINPCSE
jgi:hypothetical protein